MKNLFIYLAATLITVSVTSCKKPESCINAPAIVEVGQSATFTSCSINADQYKWSMGDGTFITSQTATYTYSNPGIYQVSLTASKGSKDNTTSIPVQVVSSGYKFIGNYTANDDCIGSHAITIQELGNTQIRILNFADQGWTVTANVSGNNFQIVPQYGLWDTWGEQYDLLSGSGTINGNMITFDFTLSDIPYLNAAGMFQCSGTYQK